MRSSQCIRLFCCVFHVWRQKRKPYSETFRHIAELVTIQKGTMCDMVVGHTQRVIWTCFFIAIIWKGPSSYDDPLPEAFELCSHCSPLSHALLHSSNHIPARIDAHVLREQMIQGEIKIALSLCCFCQAMEKQGNTSSSYPSLASCCSKAG
jgi:hypothetical protein